MESPPAKRLRPQGQRPELAQCAYAGMRGIEAEILRIGPVAVDQDGGAGGAMGAFHVHRSVAW